MSCVSASSPVKPVWRGRDNTILLRLDRTAPSGDTSAVDLAGVSKMDLVINTGEVLSCAYNTPDAEINWWDDSLAIGEVMLALGGWVESIDLSSGVYSGSLVLYDIDNPDGLVWSDGKPTLTFKVIG